MSLKNFSIENHTDFLANFLPNGRLTHAKFVESTNLRKYLKGKAAEFKRLNDLFVTFLSELDPRSTTLFIENWESAIKIPDNCIPIASTIEDRRENVVLKLVSLSVQTEQDFKDLALTLGFTINFPTDRFPPHSVPHSLKSIVTTNNFPPHAVPHTIFIPIDSRFFVVITGNFGISAEKKAIFQCLIDILSPSTYKIVLLTI